MQEEKNIDPKSSTIKVCFIYQYFYITIDKVTKGNF